MACYRHKQDAPRDQIPHDTPLGDELLAAHTRLTSHDGWLGTPMKQSITHVTTTRPYKQTTQTRTTTQGTPHRAEPWGTKAHHTGRNKGPLRLGQSYPPCTNEDFNGQERVACPCHALGMAQNRDSYSECAGILLDNHVCHPSGSFYNIMLVMPLLIASRPAPPSIETRSLPHQKGLTRRTDNETTMTLRCSHGALHKQLKKEGNTQGRGHKRTGLQPDANG